MFETPKIFNAQPVYERSGIELETNFPYASIQSM